MTKRLEIYRCDICGNIVEVLHSGAGKLVCCDKEMELLKEQTQDASIEKHVPYIEKKDGKIFVKVGQNQAHPMEEKHFIEWIEVVSKDRIMRAFLNPGDKPESEFTISDVDYAREYCNVHGLWKS